MLNTIDKVNRRATLGKILVIACEPWEIELGVKTVSKIENYQDKFIFLIADYYSFVYQSKFIEKIFTLYNIEYLTFEQLYRNWQRKHAIDTQYNDEFLADWESNFATLRNMHELISTNQFITLWENKKFYYDVSDAEQNEVSVSLIKFVQEIIDINSIKKIIALGRRSFLANVAYEYSIAKELKMLTLISTRFEFNWQLREDFGLGTCEKYLDEIKSTEIRDETNKIVDDLKHSYKLFRAPSYEIAEKLENESSKSYLYLLKQIGFDIRRIISRALFDKKSRKFKVKKFGENLYALSLFELLKTFRAWFIMKNHKNVFFKGDLKSNSFAWFLHARPEDATSILGLGKDEVKEILKISKILPEGCILYVKENAQMLGARPLKFYRSIARLDNVRVLGPTFENSIILKNVKGVLGLAGTVLLEAKLLEKPAYSLGIPEFIGILDNQNCGSVVDFLKLAKKNSGKSSNLLAMKYLQWTLDNDFGSDVEFSSDLNSPKAKLLFNEFSIKIQEFYAN